MASCLGHKTPLTKESGVIPPDFNQNNDTLLIISVNPFYTMSMKKHFRRKYTGNFKFVRSADGNSIEHCRYALYEGTVNTERTKIGGPFNGQQTNMISHGNFLIVDRKTNKKYVNPNIASSKFIDAYAAALDKARLD
jgi:hypothetical protein